MSRETVRCCGRENTCRRDALSGYDFCLPCLEARGGGCGAPGHYGGAGDDGSQWCATCERMTMPTMPVHRPSNDWGET